MRLGGPVLEKFSGPEEWVAALRKRGYTSAICPLDETADGATIRAYEDAAAGAGIVIAEVGAWSNPISPDAATRKKALELCQKRLALADEIGALCCVNIAGSRHPTNWDGPHPDHARPETFDMIVESVRTIIDAVKPKRTTYTLETMPWVPPDTTDSYVALMKAIDRPACSAHCDPVNFVNSPSVFYRNADMIRDFFARLGPQVKSCHAKDSRLTEELTAHLEEAVPGRGGLDYRVYLSEIRRVNPEMPLIVEHLKTEEEYSEAAGYIRKVAAEIGWE